MNLKNKLVLSGCMGAGKSTVGRLLVEGSDLPFVDLDEAIAARAGKSVAAIFADDGEEAFRALEAEELTRLLDTEDPVVVAVGGGALVDRSLRHHALSRAVVVTLTAPVEVLAERTKGSDRPLLRRGGDPRATLERILDARRDAYAEAHAVIDTAAVTPAAAAPKALAALARGGVLVALGAQSYLVESTPGSLARLASFVAGMRASQVFLITDTTVDRLWGQRLSRFLQTERVEVAHKIAIEPGEKNKTLDTYATCLRELVDAGADRDAVIVAHGGGVVTDIAGFVASSLLRGVRWVAAPTTLLAMVDASVGGKTGVDVGLAKNAAGAFHHPRGVFIDASQTRTETPRAFTAALAEVVKTAAIGDADLFELLEAHVADLKARKTDLIAKVVARSVEVKAAIVARDPTEKGERAHLNFGHTIGHALEAQGGFERLTHGEAVSLGMVAALRLGVSRIVTPPELVERVTALLAALGLPTRIDSEALREALPFVGLDKKRSGKTVKFVFLEGVARPVRHPLELAELQALATRELTNN